MLFFSTILCTSFSMDEKNVHLGVRNLKLEKTVDSEQLRLVVETEEKRRARLENVAATKWLRFAMEMDEERKSRLEKIVTTAQLSPDYWCGQCGCGFVPQTHSEKLATMLIIQT